MTLHALTVTLPEEIVDVIAGRAGGASTGAGRMGSVQSTIRPPNPPTASGITFSTAQAGGAHRRQETPPLASVWPPRPTSSSVVPSASARAPAVPPGLDTTSDNIPTEMEEEQGNDGDYTTIAAVDERGRNGTARESNRSVRQTTLPAGFRTQEDGATAVATAAAPLQQQTRQQKQERRQPHESKEQHAQGHQQLQMPLSSLLSSPSLLCRTDSTHQTRAREPTGNGGSDIAGDCGIVGGDGDERGGGDVGVGDGNYRSIFSCPAIGVTDTSPLFSRHELTDRSALERSQRLVSF